MAEGLKRLGKGTLIYGVGGILNRFISFLLLPVFTAYLTPSDYGISALLGMTAYFLTPIFSLGFGTSMGICYFEVNDRRRKDAAIWTAFAILLLSASVFALGSLIFAGQISRLLFQTDAYRYLVLITALGASWGILVSPFMWYLQFDEKARTYVTLTIISTITSIGISVLMVVILKKGITGLIEAGMIGQIINFSLFFVIALRRVGWHLDIKLGKELIKFGLPMVPAFMSLFILLQGNRFILQWFRGLEQVGVYTIGFSLGMLMNLFVNGFTSAWTPYFLSYFGKQEEGRLLFGKVLTYYIFSFGALSLLFYIFARPVVMIMTQPAFHEAYKSIGLSATAQFLIGVFSILLPGIYFAKEVKYITIIQAISAALSVGISFILVPPFGITGAAISLAGGFLILAILQYLCNFIRRDKYLKVHYEWNRIIPFTALYIIYMLALLSERYFSLAVEITLSCLAAVLLTAFVYLLLKRDEKGKLIKTLKTIIFSLTGSKRFEPITTGESIY